jgi:hypothetical protein
MVWFVHFLCRNILFLPPLRSLTLIRMANVETYILTLFLFTCHRLVQK